MFMILVFQLRYIDLKRCHGSLAQISVCGETPIILTPIRAKEKEAALIHGVEQKDRGLKTRRRYDECMVFFIFSGVDHTCFISLVFLLGFFVESPIFSRSDSRLYHFSLLA